MNQAKKVLGIIPARFNSIRFPGKPLALIEDRPMIQWVYEAVDGICDYLAVATDSQAVAGAVKKFGGNVVLTSDSHPSGTDRCLEAMQKLEKEGDFIPDIVLNIQGDEPLIRREQILELLSGFSKAGTRIVTLAKPFGDDEDPGDPDKVKVVMDRNNQALYFSRALIPYPRKRREESPYYKHVGIYGFKSETLKEVCMLPPSELERAESLEQLRWLENGFPIDIRLTRYSNQGIDTPEDLARLLEFLKKGDHS